MSFGRLDRRIDISRGRDIIEAISATAGGRVPENLARNIARGAAEVDLVRSGLEDTMRTAYDQMRQIWYANDSIVDLRTAAYRLGIEKVARAYQQLGVWP
jgi:glutamate dehydrogenase (NAD(P)+)